MDTADSFNPYLEGSITQSSLDKVKETAVAMTLHTVNYCMKSD